MHRFFVSEEAIQDDQVLLTGPVAYQVRKVLRMAAGDRIVVLDNSGWEREVELTQVSTKSVRGTVVRQALCETEPRTKITLYQALLKGQRFEYALQKGTELGIVEFVPMISARCIVSDLGRSDQKTRRWSKIIREAAEQAHRGRLPELRPAMFFREACLRATRAGELALIPWEGEEERTLHQMLDTDSPPFSVSLFIGPEGGFEESEIGDALRMGVLPVSLGPRILRAETAGIAAASAILYALGDFGS